jgi:hypothetical protein
VPLVRSCPILLFALAFLACHSDGPALSQARAGPSTDPGTLASPAASAPIAVVELFTSEGCSSCPSAEALLADLSRRSTVYALAFHVDYWDGLGWPDRFASSEYTERQLAYARSFGSEGLYTPQMVVDGTEVVSGSDRAGTEASLDRALSRPSPATVSVRAHASGAGTIRVDYTVAGAVGDAVLDVAAVERSVSTEVRAGENAGRTLHHVNVVRAFVALSRPESSGSTTMRVSVGSSPDNLEVIAYLQQLPEPARGMRVLGAARSPLL